MKLAYNILCIDDKIRTLAQAKAAFLEFNSDVGIEVIYHDIVVAPGAREKPGAFRKRILDELAAKFSNTIFDLIIVDLHMGKIKGDDIIATIRDTHTIYRPIVFYSAGVPRAHETAEKQLNKAAKQAGIFGKSIFTTYRDNLLPLLKRIAEEMHAEEHRINQVRGLLMDSVSELDAKIVEAIKLNKLWDAVPDDKRKKILKEFKDRVKSKYTKSKEMWDAVEHMGYDEIRALILNDTKKIEVFTKGKVLREILAHNATLKGLGTILSDSLKKNVGLTSIRNNYAHQTASILNTTHTPAQCKYIREESRRQLINIEATLK